MAPPYTPAVARSIACTHTAPLRRLQSNRTPCTRAFLMRGLVPDTFVLACVAELAQSVCAAAPELSGAKLSEVLCSFRSNVCK